jgi:hypothetical protein
MRTAPVAKAAGAFFVLTLCCGRERGVNVTFSLNGSILCSMS